MERARRQGGRGRRHGAVHARRFRELGGCVRLPQRDRRRRRLHHDAECGAARRSDVDHPVRAPRPNDHEGCVPGVRGAARHRHDERSPAPVRHGRRTWRRRGTDVRTHASVATSYRSAAGGDARPSFGGDTQCVVRQQRRWPRAGGHGRQRQPRVHPSAADSRSLSVHGVDRHRMGDGPPDRRNDEPARRTASVSRRADVAEDLHQPKRLSHEPAADAEARGGDRRRAWRGGEAARRPTSPRR